MAAPQSCLLAAKELGMRTKESSIACIEEECSMDAEYALALGTEYLHLPCVPPDSSEQDEEGILLAGKYFLPPGFRFHPTDQELVLYYLKRKICGLKMELDIIAEIDLYEFEPWDLHGFYTSIPDSLICDVMKLANCDAILGMPWFHKLDASIAIRSRQITINYIQSQKVSCLQTKDLLWYFFCPKMRKYPKGNRENRATPVGRWKPSGKDRPVLSGSRLVGTRKCLIYYVKREKKEERTDWVMHEFRLSEDEIQRLKAKQNDFVLSRVFKKSGRGSKRGQVYGVVIEDEEVESLHETKGDGCGAGYTREDQHVGCQADREDLPGRLYAHGYTPSESTESEIKSSINSSRVF